MLYILEPLDFYYLFIFLFLYVFVCVCGVCVQCIVRILLHVFFNTNTRRSNHILESVLLRYYAPTIFSTHVNLYTALKYNISSIKPAMQPPIHWKGHVTRLNGSSPQMWILKLPSMVAPNSARLYRQKPMGPKLYASFLQAALAGEVGEGAGVWPLLEKLASWVPGMFRNL